MLYFFHSVYCHSVQNVHIVSLVPATVTLASETGLGWWGKGGWPSGASGESPFLSHSPHKDPETHTTQMHGRAQFHARIQINAKWQILTDMNKTSVNGNTLRQLHINTIFSLSHTHTLRSWTPCWYQGRLGDLVSCWQTAPYDSARPAARWQCQARWRLKEEVGGRQVEDYTDYASKSGATFISTWQCVLKTDQVL